MNRRSRVDTFPNLTFREMRNKEKNFRGISYQYRNFSKKILQTSFPKIISLNIFLIYSFQVPLYLTKIHYLQALLRSLHHFDKIRDGAVSR
jgi:hypothetical protein